MHPTKLPATPSPAVAEVTQLEKRWLTFLPNAGTRTIPESGGPRPLVVNKGLEILILPPQLGDGGVALLQRRAQALALCVRRCQLLRHRLHQPASAGIGEVQYEAKLTVNCGSCSQTLGAD